MKIIFHKYQGTGNDFIMLNNLNGEYDDLTLQQISFLCNRKFGIGADGLIKINKHSSFDFEVDYYNADGTKSFCGNGARCAVMFVKSIGIITSKSTFLGIDGSHNAFIDELNLVHLDMNAVKEVQSEDDNYELYTGSPHFVLLNDDLSPENCFALGQSIRYSEKYKTAGINVNLMQEIGSNSIAIATYERGVENETLSCGTGATACAIVYGVRNHLNGIQVIDVKVKGGKLKVSYELNANNEFINVRLIGPAEFVYQGEING